MNNHKKNINMDKIKKHNLKVKLRVLNDNLLKVSQEIKNITDSIQISEEAPITDTPKSAPFNVTVENTLHDLDERIRAIELYLGLYFKKEQPEPEPENQSFMPKEYGGKMNCKQEEHAEPQPERKIVLDWFIHPERGPSKAFLDICNFNEIKVIAEIGFGKYVFLLTTIHSIHPLIYIGHYKD
jgi:hypothetical protein